MFGIVPVLLSLALCVPAPLPPRAAWTDEVLNEYLNQTLHSCFDHLDQAIANTQVRLDETAVLAFTNCRSGRACDIAIHPTLIQELHVLEIAFLVGHEAAHIALLGEDFRGVEEEEIEYVADLIAARSLHAGSCHGARTLQYLLDVLPKQFATKETIDEIEKRRRVLIAHCAAEIAFAHDD